MVPHPATLTPRSSGGLFIGVMSGTSMDGADAVLARFEPGLPPAHLAAASVTFPAMLRDTLIALNTSGADELHRAAVASTQLAHVYAEVIEAVLLQAGRSPEDIVAVGVHGQTVRHRPEVGYTVQLNAPALLAELSGIAVVSDFRSRDVAAGGHGAPLVPAFHAGIFSGNDARIIINLGGIANITALAPNHDVTGFDTGPANVLMDIWCTRHLEQPYDAAGAWAATGTIDTALLDSLIESEPWLRLPPPKSTGRDLFNAAWLDQRLADFASRWPARTLRPEDVQATLSAFTAQTITHAIRTWMPEPQSVWAAGGGAHNDRLLHDLHTALGVPVATTDALGVPAQHVEAYAFAWLAYAHCAGLPGNLPAVTGARGLRILGSYTPV